MSVKRGDVGMCRFPHSSGQRGKKRPVLVVQSDTFNNLRHAIVPEISSNLAAAGHPTCLLIDISTPEGKATGLDKNLLVTCLFLATGNQDRISPVIGQLSAAMMQKIDRCLKTAMELP